MHNNVRIIGGNSLEAGTSSRDIVPVFMLDRCRPKAYISTVFTALIDDKYLILKGRKKQVYQIKSAGQNTIVYSMDTYLEIVVATTFLIEKGC